MDAHDPKTEKPDAVAHLRATVEQTLRRRAERRLEAVLAELRTLFAPPTCPRCVDRALAVASAMVFIRQTVVMLDTVDELEQFMSIIVKGLVQEFRARRAAEAQDATTTPPPAVH